MKKTILISLVILVAILLTAATPAPYQKISGTLLYSRNTICGYSDYIALPIMENVYLIGSGFPTQGQLEGCQISALGRYMLSSSSMNQCKVFNVKEMTLNCTTSEP